VQLIQLLMQQVNARPPLAVLLDCLWSLDQVTVFRGLPFTSQRKKLIITSPVWSVTRHFMGHQHFGLILFQNYPLKHVQLLLPRTELATDRLEAATPLATGLLRPGERNGNLPSTLLTRDGINLKKCMYKCKLTVPNLRK